jgi:hypothetical protein
MRKYFTLLFPFRRRSSGAPLMLLSDARSCLPVLQRLGHQMAHEQDRRAAAKARSANAARFLSPHS